ncbi:hypothetical protein MAHJHV33_48620 [Mycobacterium avium subsp. hominissuis]
MGKHRRDPDNYPVPTLVSGHTPATEKQTQAHGGGKTPLPCACVCFSVAGV